MQYSFIRIPYILITHPVQNERIFNWLKHAFDTNRLNIMYFIIEFDNTTNASDSQAFY